MEGESMSKKKKAANRTVKHRVSKAKETAISLRPWELQPAVEDPVEQAVRAREAKLPEGVGLNMQALMERAIDKAVPMEYLEKLIGLINAQRERWAKERFFEDLAAAQIEFPIIEKLGQARNTQSSCPICHGKPGEKEKCEACDGTGFPLLYRYVRYEDIVEKVAPILGRHGFSTTTNAHPYKSEELGVEMMRATCILRHRDGHSEETVIDVPIGEGTRLMSPGQRYMAAKSFAKRHAYKDALGIAERGEDVEGPDDKEEDRRSVPQPVAGVRATNEGVVQEGTPKPAKEKDHGARVLTTIEEAKESLREIYARMAQVYNGMWEPMYVTGKNGRRPLTQFPPAETEGGPFNRLYTEEELAAYANSTKKFAEDAAKLADMRIDWEAGLAERVAEARGRRE
jgi:hypothetical protein